MDGGVLVILLPRAIFDRRTPITAAKNYFAYFGSGFHTAIFTTGLLHNMIVIHNAKRYETPKQKLQTLILQHPVIAYYSRRQSQLTLCKWHTEKLLFDIFYVQ